MSASIRSDRGPICRSGFSVRCPWRAAVSSPMRQAIAACANSCTQIENTMMITHAKYPMGSVNKVWMNR